MTPQQEAEKAAMKEIAEYFGKDCINDKTGIAKDFYLSGYAAASQQQADKMARFAEWLAARYNYTHKGWVGWSDVLNEEIYMISAKPDAEYYTTQQLIQKFEEDEKL